MITYDPNIRPALLGSHMEAKATFEELVPLTDVVKLSDEDAQWLYPQKSLDETAAHIIGLGAGLTVITMGAEGSHFTTSAANIGIPAVKSKVADTIGAGDSYMSALILGFVPEEPKVSPQLSWSSWDTPQLQPRPSPFSAREQTPQPWKNSTSPSKPIP